jgi:dihydropteroate synthase
MQKLGEVVEEITSTAPALKVSFNLLVTAEGDDVDRATVDALKVWNAVAAVPLPRGKPAAAGLRWPDDE